MSPWLTSEDGRITLRLLEWLHDRPLFWTDYAAIVSCIAAGLTGRVSTANPDRPWHDVALEMRSVGERDVDRLGDRDALVTCLHLLCEAVSALEQPPTYKIIGK